MQALARILVVGDEPAVLDELGRASGRGLAVDTARTPETGLDRIREEDPYAVVLADLDMRPMNGAQFLVAARRLSPDTSHVLLAGPAEFADAAPTMTSAFNSGGIMRVLLKPVARAELISALDAGVEHSLLVTAERDLLENTLGGSVRALMEVLALASPASFERSMRLRDLMTAMIRAAGGVVCWHDELAAMLGQVGAIAVPAEVLQRAERGDGLDGAELALLSALPGIADRMLAGIPRIDQVREAILSQDARYDGQSPSDPRVGEAIPFGGRALRVARDFDALSTAGVEPHAAVWTMRTRHGSYDPRLIDALAAVVAERAKRRLHEVAVVDLAVGMILADEVTTTAGATLVAPGHELTVGMLERIRGFAAIPPGVSEPVRVYLTARAGRAPAPWAVAVNGRGSA